MPNYSYFNTPIATNNPADDQPNMNTNFASVNSLLGTDHVSFNENNGGTHLQCTFNSENTPSTPTDPTSVLFTTAGAASSVADLRFINHNATFPLNFIRAAGVCTSAGIASGQSFNLSGATPFVRNSAGFYTITLAANVVTGTNYGVIASTSKIPSTYGVAITVNILSATQFQIVTEASNNPSTGTDPVGIFSFMVFQI